MLAHNLSPRTAHRLVGHAVLLAHQTGCRLDAALLDQAARVVLQRPLTLPEQFIAAQLDPHAIVDSRTTIGGAAREQVQGMLADGHAVVATYRAWVTEHQHRLEAAERALIEEARRRCQPT
jgi:argininosuccinate lyase